MKRIIFSTELITLLNTEEEQVKRRDCTEWCNVDDDDDDVGDVCAWMPCVLAEEAEEIGRRRRKWNDDPKK